MRQEMMRRQQAQNEAAARQQDQQSQSTSMAMAEKKDPVQHEMMNQPQAQQEHAARHQEPSTSISTHSYFLGEHNQGDEEREAEKEADNSERSAAHRRAEDEQEMRQHDNVLAGERWQATRRDDRARPEDELTSYLWEKAKKEKAQLKQSADKRRREESSSSSTMSSPTKPPPSQRRRERSSTASANVPSITNVELINHMSSTGLQYTNPFIREKVEEYILQKLGMEESELTEHQKKELDSCSKMFYKTFLKKRTEVSRNVSRIQESAWGQNQISIPKSLLSTPATPAPLAAAALAPAEISTASVMPKFSHSELAVVMKNNSSNFTDNIKQAKAVRDHILSGLGLTVEDLDDCLDELEETVRKFVRKM
jgi:hypothetical protein